MGTVVAVGLPPLVAVAKCHVHISSRVGRLHESGREVSTHSKAHSATLLPIRAALRAWIPRVEEATSQTGVAFLKSKFFVDVAPYNDTDKQPIICHNSLVQ